MKTQAIDIWKLLRSHNYPSNHLSVFLTGAMASTKLLHDAMDQE
ncbi:MAG: hypothetical protein ACRAVC_06625 [Trichormus sp.]